MPRQPLFSTDEVRPWDVKYSSGGNEDDASSLRSLFKRFEDMQIMEVHLHLNDFQDVEQWHFQMGDLVRRLERLEYDDLRFLANRVSSSNPHRWNQNANHNWLRQLHIALEEPRVITKEHLLQ